MCYVKATMGNQTWICTEFIMDNVGCTSTCVNYNPLTTAYLVGKCLNLGLLVLDTINVSTIGYISMIKLDP